MFRASLRGRPGGAPLGASPAPSVLGGLPASAGSLLGARLATSAYPRRADGPPTGGSRASERRGWESPPARRRPEPPPARDGGDALSPRRAKSSPSSPAQPPAGYLGKHTGAAPPGLGLPLDAGDRSIARDLRRVTSAAELVRHFAENRESYNAVSTATALNRLVALTEGVKPWKRRPLPREGVNALVAAAVEGLADAVGAFAARTAALKEAAAAAAAAAAAPSDSLVNDRRKARLPPAVTPRTLASLAYGLTKLDRAPPGTLHELSSALAERLELTQQQQQGKAAVASGAPPSLSAAAAALDPEALSAGDVVQLTYAFSRAHVPAPRLFNRLGAAITERLNREVASAAAAAVEEGEDAAAAGAALDRRVAAGGGGMRWADDGAGSALQQQRRRRLGDDADAAADYDSDIDGGRRAGSSRPLKPVRDALREAARPFTNGELGSLLLSYSSLRTAAPGVYAAAAAAVERRVAAAAAAADNPPPKPFRRDADADDAEEPDPAALTSHASANLAVAFARAMGQQPPASAAAVASLSSSAAPPVAASAARALAALAPHVTALAASARVPIVQPTAFTAQGLAGSAWAYARAFTGPALPPGAVDGAGNGGGGKWSSVLLAPAAARSAVDDAVRRLLAGASIGGGGGGDAQRKLAALLRSAQEAAPTTGVDGAAAWDALVAAGAVEPGASLYRVDPAAAGVNTANDASEAAARLAALRLPDAVVVRLLTALGRGVAHSQTARTLGPGQVASLARAWADVRAELQRRAANAVAYAAAADAAAADARPSAAPAARLLASASAAEAARAAALLASYDSACARPVFDALIKQGLWLADPAASGHQAAAAAARARERLGLPPAGGAAVKSGAASASAADAAADDAAEAAAAATAAAAGGGRGGRALPSRDRMSAAMGAARAQARAAVADGAADADGDERDAAELAELMEADDGADGDVDGGDVLLSSARAAAEARAAAAAAAASRPRFSPLEGEANLALASTFTLHDAVELLHAAAVGYPASSASPSSVAAVVAGAAPPPSSADSHPGLAELFIKTARWIGALEAQYEAAVASGAAAADGDDGAGGSSANGSGPTPWKRSLRDLSGPDAVRLAQAFVWAAPPREAGRVVALLAGAVAREHSLWDGGRGSVIEVDRDGIDDDEDGEVVDVTVPRGSLPPGVTERYGLPPSQQQSSGTSRGNSAATTVTPAFDTEPTYSAPEWRGAARGAARAGGPLAHRVRGTGGGAGSATSLGATPLLVAREGGGSGAPGSSAPAVPIGAAVPSWVRDKGLVGPRSRLHTTRGSWAGRLLGHTPLPALLALVEAVATVLPAASDAKRLDKTALTAWREAVAGGGVATAAPGDADAQQQQQAALLARWEAVRAAYDALPPELTLPGGAYHGLPAVALSQPAMHGHACGLSGRAAVERIRRLEGAPLAALSAGDEGDQGDAAATVPEEVSSLLAMVAARVAARPSEAPADRLARTLALAAGRAGGVLVAQPASADGEAITAPPPPLARLVTLGAGALADDASAGARFLPTRTHARLTAAVGAAVVATLPQTRSGTAGAADVEAALRRAEPFHRHLHAALSAVYAAAAVRLAAGAAGRSLPVHDALLVAAAVPAAAALVAGVGSRSRGKSSATAAGRLPAHAAALLAAAAPTLAVAAPTRCAAALAALAPPASTAAAPVTTPIDVRSCCNVLASAMSLRVAAVQAADAAAVAVAQPVAAAASASATVTVVRTRRAAVARVTA